MRVPADEEGKDGDEPSAPEACAGADFGMGALAPADLHLLGVPDVASDVEIPEVETVYEPSVASDVSGRSAHALLEDELPVATPHGFVVSQVSARQRRLHLVGHCVRRQGEHYRDYIVFGDAVPTESDFDKVCCSCFPRGFVTADELPEDSGSGGSNSLSTTNCSGA